MTNEELTVMRDLCGDIIEANAERSRLSKELVTKEFADKSIVNELNQLRERNAMATAANEDLKKRCTELMAERDDARRKLGALVLCVGFLKDYDTRHPKKSLENLKAKVKRCIDENHIVLTERGMAK